MLEFKIGDMVVGADGTKALYSLTNEDAMLEVIGIDKVQKTVDVKLINSLQCDLKEIDECIIGTNFKGLKGDFFRLAEPEDFIKFNKGVRYEYEIHKRDTV